MLAYTIRYRQFLDYFLKTKDFSGPTSNAVMCIFAIKKNRYVCNSSIFYGFVFSDKTFNPIHSNLISIIFSEKFTHNSGNSLKSASLPDTVTKVCFIHKNELNFCIYTPVFHDPLHSHTFPVFNTVYPYNSTLFKD